MRRFVRTQSGAKVDRVGLYSIERYLRDFIEWADARSVTHPEHVSQAVLERYQRYLHYYRKKDGSLKPLPAAAPRLCLCVVSLNGSHAHRTNSRQSCR